MKTKQPKCPHFWGEWKDMFSTWNANVNNGDKARRCIKCGVWQWA